MTQRINKLLKELPRFRKEAEGMRDILLANLVMLGEIPAPTFHEDARIEMLMRRFSECGLHNCSTDEKGNAFGVLPGTKGKRNIVIATNADTLIQEDVNPSVEIREKQVTGPFVGDNSIALSALVSLPILMEKLGIELESNLILTGFAQSLGRGNLEGLRFFLKNSAVPLHSGISFESVQLGRLNYSCLGMLRGEIRVRLPEDYNWVQFGSTGSIIPMNDVISKISKIPLPHRPMTSLVIGSIHGGISYHNIARQVTLGFEARSESEKILKEIEQQVVDIVEGVAASSGVLAKLNVFARREAGGIDISHPLVRNARVILDALKIKPMMYPTTSALSAFLDTRVPAITLGCTTADRRDELAEIGRASCRERV